MSVKPHAEPDPVDNKASHLSVRPGLRTAVVCALLFAGTAFLFGRALDCEFVNYDDPGYITGNPHVQGGLSWPGIVWAFTAQNDYWHPLTWLSHMIDWELFGDAPAGHHLTNVVWHAMNAALAFLVFLRLAGGFDSFTAGGLWRSAFAAALFAWHPLRVESVVWVTERKDVMSGFFFLLSLLAYARYADARAAGRSAWRRYLAVVACFVAGLMSKPMLVTLPLVFLLLDFWPLRRATSLPAWRPLVVEKLPLFALSGAIAVTTLLMQEHIEGFVLDLSAGERIGNAVVSLARYMGNFLWPSDLIVCYAHPGSWPFTVVAGASAFVLGLGALSWWQLQTRPWVAVGLGWYLITLLPVLGLVQAGFQAMADRYTYLPMLGVELAVLWSLPTWAARPQRVVVACVASVILAFCAALTWRQEAVWKDSVSLFSHAVRVDDRNDIAKDFLASALFAAGRFDEAAEHASRARALNPRNDRALVTLAGLAEQKGDMGGAVALYREALEIRPDSPLVQCQLGLLEFDRGNAGVARPLLTAAVRSSRPLLERTLEIARGAYLQGHGDEARFLFEVVLAGAPEEAEAHAGVGMILMARNDAAAAIDHLRAAATRLPGRADVQLALARCAQQLGRDAEAATALGRAVNAAPANPAILSAAAELHARRREFTEAAALYRRLIELAPNDSRAHAGLGYMLVLTGDREGGRAEWKRALEIDPEFPGLRERLRQLEER